MSAHDVAQGADARDDAHASHARDDDDTRDDAHARDDVARPLTIALVCFPSYGGSGVIASELGFALAERGHHVHFVSAEVPVRLRERTLAPVAGRVHFHEVAAHAPRDPLSAALSSGPLTRTLVTLGHSVTLDVIHAHYALPHALAAIDAARELHAARRPRVVTTLHGTDVTFAGVEPRHRPFTTRAIEESDAVTAPSSFLRDVALRELAAAHPPRIEVVPNFVDTARFAPRADRAPLATLFDDLDDNTAIVTHVSNFRAVKRAHDVIDVFARVAERVDARLLLVGDGPEHADVVARAHARGLAPLVRAIGATDRFEALLASSTVFLLPSASESFGLAALEAMSAGVPVVATAQGGLVEVVRPGETGFLAPVGDVDELARHVLRVCADPALHAALSRGARAHVVAHFSREPAVSRYEALYRRVVDAPRPWSKDAHPVSTR